MHGDAGGGAVKNILRLRQPRRRILVQRCASCDEQKRRDQQALAQRYGPGVGGNFLLMFRVRLEICFGKWGLGAVDRQ